MPDVTASRRDLSHAALVRFASPVSTEPAGPFSLKPGPDSTGTKQQPAVLRASSGESNPMWKSVLSEARELVWLASIVGGLSVASVGIAITLVTVG